MLPSSLPCYVCLWYLFTYKTDISPIVSFMIVERPEECVRWSNSSCLGAPRATKEKALHPVVEVEHSFLMDQLRDILFLEEWWGDSHISSLAPFRKPQLTSHFLCCMLFNSEAVSILFPNVTVVMMWKLCYVHAVWPFMMLSIYF